MIVVLTICNTGGTKTCGNYAVQAYGQGTGEVKDYPRETVAVLNLVRRAIEAAGYTK